MIDRPLCVLTGASSEIGTAIARTVAILGHDLVLVGRSSAKLERAAETCRKSGAKVLVEATDLRQQVSVDELASRVFELAPSVLVHCAGLFDWSSIEQADWSRWEELIEVNLTAMMRLTHHLIPKLTSTNHPAIIFIASAAGHQGFSNNAAYVASKHGVVGFARGVFQDLRNKGVKVSVISPGLVDAGAALNLPEGQHHTFLSAEDVADAVRYVLTSSSRACPTEIHLQPQLRPTLD